MEGAARHGGRGGSNGLAVAALAGRASQRDRDARVIRCVRRGARSTSRGHRVAPAKLCRARHCGVSVESTAADGASCAESRASTLPLL